MKRPSFLVLRGILFLASVIFVACPAAAADSPLAVPLWPGQPPEETGDFGAERTVMSPKLDRKQVEVTEPTRMITAVTKPTLTLYRPAKANDTGTAMLICPGGGYWNLYWELEGEEVAAWLNQLGVTGIILKYRVPRRPDEPKGEPARRPLQDAQRAVSLVRSKAAEWGIHPQRIGMVGFSAGGHLAIATATRFEQRTYEPIDHVDQVSCRPDFAVAVYSGYLKAKDKDELAPGLRVPAGTPLVFLAHGGEDLISPPQNSALMYLALKQAGVPTELHIYAGSAHDFGVRTNDHSCSAWTEACGNWLRHQGLLTPPAPTFADVTQESGVAEAIDRHYAAHPKWWLSGLNLVDLDGDGKLDLFFAAHAAGRSLALLGDGRGYFGEAPGSYPPSEIHLPYDLNEDGKLDLQMTWQDGGGRWWFNESTPGRLSFRESNVTAGQARISAMVDLNGDGNVDWLHERPGVAFEFGDGKGGFTSGGHLEVAATRNEINIHPADLNGDGFIDLAVQWGRYDFEKGRSRVYFNDGKMKFHDATAAAGLFEEGLVIKGIGDVNQDGHLDLLVLENRQPEIYMNDGHGKFTKQPGAISGMEAATKPRYVSWGLAVVTDFDNNGIADLLWNGRHFLWALRGTGGGHFVYANREWDIEDKSAASVDDGLCFGDMDGDGDLDLVGYTGSVDAKRWVRVYRNDLPAQHWLRVRPLGARGNRGAAGARIRLTEAGHPAKLLWFEQVMIVNSQSAHSYYSLAPTERHFGLGTRASVDVSVEFYPSGKRVEQKAVPANSTVVIQE